MELNSHLSTGYHATVNIGFFTKRDAIPNFFTKRDAIPYKSFSRKGMPSRAAASDDQVYVGNVVLLLFKYD